jgi:anti-sigma factor RsiW
MSCGSVHKLLHEAFERALTPEEQKRVDVHLEGCRACRAEAALLRAMIRALETAPAVQPSERFTLAVMDRLPAPVRIFGFLPAAAFRVAAALIGVAGAGLGWVYRTEVLTIGREAGHAAAASPAGDAMQQAYAAIQTLGQKMLAYVPVHQLDSPQWSPVVSVLIAVGVGMVILHMVNGFEPLDADLELEAAPEQSFS